MSTPMWSYTSLSPIIDSNWEDPSFIAGVLFGGPTLATNEGWLSLHLLKMIHALSAYTYWPQDISWLSIRSLAVMGTRQKFHFSLLFEWRWYRHCKFHVVIVSGRTIAISRTSFGDSLWVSLQYMSLVWSICILLPDHLLFSFFALTQANRLFLTSPTNFYPGSMADRKFILLS